MKNFSLLNIAVERLVSVIHFQWFEDKSEDMKKNLFACSSQQLEGWKRRWSSVFNGFIL